MVEPIHFSQPLETTPTMRREMRQQAQQSADPWTIWARDLGERLLAVETRLKLFLGDPAQPDAENVLKVVIGEERSTVEETIRTTAEALREEAQVELAVVRDEVMSRFDRMAYGSGLDVNGEELRALVFELRRDGAASASATASQLEELAKRIDASDARRGQDRAAMKEAMKQDMAKLASLFTAMTAKTDAKIDKLTADLASLERRTAEAFNDK